MDFILPWVDGADPDWQDEFRQYSVSTSKSVHQARYRDWGTLRYWFRGVEKFAPWVNNVYLVTCGQIPAWLNTGHPKLRVVTHDSYLPKRYLPTFNSRTIELNFHRIEPLSEQYVLFNDDTFLLQPVPPEFFFVEGRPCDEAAMMMLTGGRYQHTLLENVALLKSHNDNKWRTVAHAPSKWFHPRYGKHALYNMLLTCVTRHYPGFVSFHLAQPVRKSTLKRLWEVAHIELDISCRSKFRDYATVNPYVQRYWALSTNSFHPVGMSNRGKCFELREDRTEDAARFIRSQRLPLICVNDHENVADFDEASKRIRGAFESILPSPSAFERTD